MISNEKNGRWWKKLSTFQVESPVIRCFNLIKYSLTSLVWICFSITQAQHIVSLFNLGRVIPYELLYAHRSIIAQGVEHHINTLFLGVHPHGRTCLWHFHFADILKMPNAKADTDENVVSRAPFLIFPHVAFHVTKLLAMEFLNKFGWRTQWTSFLSKIIELLGVWISLLLLHYEYLLITDVMSTKF